MSAAANQPVLVGRDLGKTFRRDKGEVVRALDGVSLEARQGTLTALVGPDGAGKTTLLRLAAGLMTPDAGMLRVLDLDVASQPQQVQDRLGYMPQKFGLYEDLTVRENLTLYADLHALNGEQRRQRFPRLMDMTALGPFLDRLAGRLSGGMKQKLGLACTLVSAPDLLLLDEPTVGVDPLSRRELWDIILHLVQEQGLTVLLSTSYLDEAERCEHVVVLHQGKVLAQGPPPAVRALAAGRTFLAEPPGRKARALQALLLDSPEIIDAVPEGGLVRFVRSKDSGQEAGAPQDGPLAGVKVTATPPRFEDGFMVLLRSGGREAWSVERENRSPVFTPHASRPTPHEAQRSGAVEVRDLVRTFGSFTAVDHVNFEVRRGEIFGLLGPNGAGKTTTFRMLCGLLPATGGTLRVAGADLRRARAEARRRIGYVAQKFSLYGQLSVRENLDFFAGAYGLRGRRRSDRIAWAMQQFELTSLAGVPSGQLPGGYKQRLAMAAALLHEPEILFLDEPTSGADPLARREFWRRITDLAEQGVTVIVTTHFLEEAEYCDHVVILDAGQVLAQGTPAEVRSQARPAPGHAPTMEDAFIAVVEEARSERRQEGDKAGRRRALPASLFRTSWLPAPLRRVRALVWKEARQIFRDPSSIAIGIVLPVLLILLFGYGVSLDVTNVPVAVVLEEPSPETMELATGFQLSPYFDAQLLASMPEALELLRDGQVDGIVRIRPDYARNLALGQVEVQVLVNGVDANRARIIQGYAEGAIGQWAARRSAEGKPVAAGPVVVTDRLWFNEANDSHYFLIPGLIVLIMTLIGALLTSLVMAREWERGTLEALFVTPVRAGEILLGKTIPYFVLGLVGLLLCLLASRFLFHVPFRGSVWVLVGVSMLYLLVALAIGLLISSATRSQFVASQVTLLVTFLPAVMLSGFLFDLRSMPAAVRLLTYALPARYYVALLQTVFLAGDVPGVLVPNAAVLAGMAAVLLLLTRRVARKRLV
jgi:ABC-type multidrug transport system ATPase subunit/ABC-type multidrug transport system permease subunit